MSDTIEKEQCPNCGRFAYYNLGNLEDVTVEDSDGGKCPWCGRVFLWPLCAEIMALEERTMDDANIIEGKKEIKP